MELKDFLHLYVGCDAKCYNGAGLQAKITGINGADSGLFSVQLRSESGLVFYRPYEDIKPILRPLSDMTEDEHALYCDIDEVSYKGGRFLSLTHNADEVLFLLRCGFDLFGLIPAGLAIDATSLTSQHP